MRRRPVKQEKDEEFEAHFSKMGLSTNSRRNDDGAATSGNKSFSSSHVRQAPCTASSSRRKSEAPTDHDQGLVHYPQSISTVVAQSRTKVPPSQRVHWEVVSPELQAPRNLEDDSSQSTQSTLTEAEESIDPDLASISELQPQATHIRPNAQHKPREKLLKNISEPGSSRSRDQPANGIPHVANDSAQKLGRSIKVTKTSDPSLGYDFKRYAQDAVEVRILTSTSTDERTTPDSFEQALYETSELPGCKTPDSYDSDNKLVVYFMRHSRKLYAQTTERMEWTVSESNHLLSCLDIPGIAVGHLHFHHNWTTGNIRIWMLHRDYFWREHTQDYAQHIAIPIRHPLFNNLYLTTFGNNSWLPNFVRLETLKKRTYALPISRLFRSDSVPTQ